MQAVTVGDERLPALLTISLIFAALALNVGLSILNTALSLPFFLDSIGTAVVSAVGGLWAGLAVALGTNVLFEVVYGYVGSHLPFALCGVTTAVIVHGAVRAGRFATAGHVVWVSLGVALANAICGGIVAAFVYGGTTGAAIDLVVTGLVAGGQTLLTASFWARVPINVVDKFIAVFIAFLVRRALARRPAHATTSGAAAQ